MKVIEGGFGKQEDKSEDSDKDEYRAQDLLKRVLEQPEIGDFDECIIIMQSAGARVVLGNVEKAEGNLMIDRAKNSLFEED